MSPSVKRQNFDVTPEQEAEIASLQSVLGASSVKETILKAVRLSLVLANEVKKGRRIGFVDPRQTGHLTEVILPELETTTSTGWTYLIERPHSWKRQLFVKGRRTTAAQIWLDMQANGMNVKDAAENWDLPVDAIDEIVRYCDQQRDLIRLEAQEERMYLEAGGVTVAP